MTGSTTQPILAVQTVRLGKRYGDVTALGAVDLCVAPNQYFVLLGPSGGGKTTLLRLIGGFSRATSGRVLLRGEDVTDVPPDRRPTSMVFQSYALFPHMNVAKNVGYGLRLQRLGSREIGERVEHMLELVGLHGLARRMPHELSGGQQQRVQLARSLVLERDVLLLDEPLAALDANLRKDMCFELKRIQEEVGITFIHVTHNQEEAMTVADRVAIISDGELVEAGSPREVYERPRRRFTADFIGESNLFEGTLRGFDGGTARIDLGYAEVSVPTGGRDLTGERTATVSVRSEVMTLRPEALVSGGEHQAIPATFLGEVYLGLISSCKVRLPSGQEIAARRLSHQQGIELTAGQPVTVSWRTDDGCLHVD